MSVGQYARYPVEGGGSGGTITSINGDSTPSQVLNTGTSGINFAIVDSGTGTHTFNLPVSSATTTGKLSSTDWSTFNGKQSAGNYITALTGDIAASGPGSAAATLATVNSNVGTFGDATHVSSVTVNAKGLVTAASNTSIQITESQVTNLVSDLAGKQPTGNYITALTGDVSASGPGSSASTLATVNANTGSFGSSTAIPNFTVNGKGLITAASTNAVVAPAGTLSGTTLNSTVVTSSLTTVGTIGTGTWNGTTIDVGHGGTGQTTYTDGQLLIGKTTGNTLNKATLTAGTGISITNGSGSITITNTGLASVTVPKQTIYSSSSGTHTMTGTPLYVVVEMCAGGGGGGPGSSSTASGGTGGNSTFGSSFLTCNGGNGGVFNANYSAGGTASIGAGATGIARTGGSGGTGASVVGGMGGSNPFGGAGGGGFTSSNVGGNAVANTGAGGGGAGGTQGSNGGGAGGYLKAYITSSISSSYAYAVGAGGTAGTGGVAGGTGGSGVIIVTEYYQ